MDLINRAASGLTAVLLMALVGGAAASSQIPEQRRENWLDPDLAGFVLQNATHLRYEISVAKGPRVKSLLRLLQSRARQVDLGCLQDIAENADSAYELYLELKDVDRRC
jgi:hypothetical protein